MKTQPVAQMTTSSRVEDVPFVYDEFELFFDGPTPPGGHEIIEREYTAHVKSADAAEMLSGDAIAPWANAEIEKLDAETEGPRGESPAAG